MSTNDGGPMTEAERVSEIARQVFAAIHEKECATNSANLRDHFAGLAMAAHIGLEIYAKGELMPHEVAEHAYEMADVMLRAREQRT